MKIQKFDLHITKLTGKPYFENSRWNQIVIGIQNYKENQFIVFNKNYDVIANLKEKPLSIQQPTDNTNIFYL